MTHRSVHARESGHPGPRPPTAWVHASRGPAAVVPPRAQRPLSDLAPGILAAVSFAIADIACKIVLNDGMDVLTLSTFRGLFNVAFLFVWLRIGMTAVPHTPDQRWIALGVGVLFAGIVFGLFKAIELMTVPIAILSYFIYPLITGIVASLLGMERLGWKGLTAAVVAFLGLALTLGAEPGGVAIGGLSFAVGAALLRVSRAADHPRQAASRRRHADDLVLHPVVDGDLCRRIAFDLDLE